MDPEKSSRLRRIVRHAIDLTGNELSSYLDTACSEDRSLRAEVERLLAQRTGALSSNVVRDHGMDMVGRTVSHYRLVERIGEGGMGVVYKARDLRLDRFVALKFLPQRHDADEIRKERLVREAKAASALDHPNICVIHEIDETEDGQLFIAMAYYEGESLSESLAHETLGIETIQNLATQVAEGLAKAHENGIIHRDIKPANIVVTKSGVAKIVDFGLAKREEGTRLTTIGTIIGTTAYMSPEQLLGTQVDHRTDIWALGVVMYEMLAGRLPFHGDVIPAVIHSILNDDPESIYHYRAGVPERLVSAVQKALRKDVSDRYQSADELLADLRGTDAPVRLHPPQAGTLVVGDLPDQLTDFIGRERELARVASLLSSARLVTLTGPGGTGKSRLSLQVASTLGDRFQNGVSFVTLANIEDPGLVLSTIARALGVREAAGYSLLEAITEALHDREMLLVLDNFEHVITEAPLVVSLLTACPKLRVLATSREPLRVTGEQLFSVPPLTLPDAKCSLEVLSDYEAVALFVQRALAVQPDFQLTKENAETIATICIRLDGLPLAIELAAARVRFLSPEGLLARLTSSLELLTGGPRDRPERQRTLRGAIRWSHELLEPDEKKMFRRLAVFAGGCSLEAAEAVCSSLEDTNVDSLNAIASLVDKNLVQRRDETGGEPRLLMLETIREYGQECVAAAGEQERLRRAHRDFFLRLAEQCEPLLTGPQQVEHLSRLERDHDNLRAALQWSETEPNGVQAQLRLAGALWRFWLVHGHLSEGRKLLAQAMARTGASAHPKLIANALSGAATLAHNQGDYAAAGELFERALDLNRQLNDKPGIAAALNNVAWARWRQSSFATARSLSEESLALHRELGDRSGIATALANLGWVDLFQGEHARARSRFETCLELRREVRDERAVAFSQCMLGWARLKEGECEVAEALFEEASATFRNLGDKQLIAFTRSILGSLAQEQCDYGRAAALIEEEGLPLFREVGDRWGIAFALNTQARVALHQGDLARAARIHEESLAIRRETQDKWGIAQSLYGLGQTSRHQGYYDRALAFCRESLALRCEMGDRTGSTECLEELATIANSQGRFEVAACLFGAAESLRESVDTSLPPCDRAEHEAQVSRARAELGDREFLSAWARGRAMNPERATTYAFAD